MYNFLSLNFSIFANYYPIQNRVIKAIKSWKHEVMKQLENKQKSQKGAIQINGIL